MEPKGSLLCSQEPATSPYPGAAASGSHLLTSAVILYSHVCIGPPLHFSTKILCTLLIFHACYIPCPFRPPCYLML
jgi:hypothetical protein